MRPKVTGREVVVGFDMQENDGHSGLLHGHCSDVLDFPHARTSENVCVMVVLDIKIASKWR